jgi:hypothetical protein
LVAAILVASGPAHAAERSPDDRVVIVTENLEEAHNHGTDLKNMSEAKVFVNRMVDTLNYWPDIVLLQEVIRRSSTLVAKHLSKKTGDIYRVVVRPGKRVWKKIGDNKLLLRDTAIVINTATMKKSGSKSGFLRTATTWADKTATRLLLLKGHAWGLVKDRASEQKFPLTSAHLLPGRSVKDSREEFYWKQWSAKIANNLEKRWGGTDYAQTIGGDFNHQRCRYQVSWDCKPNAPFYKMLTKNRSFIDTFRKATNMKGGLGVDFIFTKHVDLISAGQDTAKDKYSDHVFRWAVVGV